MVVSVSDVQSFFILAEAIRQFGRLKHKVGVGITDGICCKHVCPGVGPSTSCIEYHRISHGYCCGRITNVAIQLEGDRELHIFSQSLRHPGLGCSQVFQNIFMFVVISVGDNKSCRYITTVAFIKVGRYWIFPYIIGVCNAILIRDGHWRPGMGPAIVLLKFSGAC